MNPRVSYDSILAARSALENVLQKTKMPSKVAALFSPSGVVLWAAYHGYLEARRKEWEEIGGRRLTDELGRMNSSTDEYVTKIALKRELERKFNDLMRPMGDQMVEFGPAVHIRHLKNVSISPLDMAALKGIGLIDDASVFERARRLLYGYVKETSTCQVCEGIRATMRRWLETRGNA